MDEVLLFILKKGGAHQPIRTTTRELGEALGMTQQNASRRLRLLESNGYVKRSADGVSLTAKAMEEARQVYAVLKNAFEKNSEFFYGTIQSGLGEGGYYLSIPNYKRSIARIVGFVPFEGTLNVEISDCDLWRRELMLARSAAIPSFEHNGRVFGGARIFFPCFIDGKKCAAVFPSRTHHHKNIIEFISEFNLKKTLRKKDGDKVKITMEQ